MPSLVPPLPQLPPVTVRLRTGDGRLIYAVVIDRDGGRVRLREAATGVERWVDSLEIVEAE
jgi:hypothetical protein